MGNRTTKILGINGSPRNEGTAYCVQALSAAAELPGITTEYISLADCQIERCDQCGTCRQYYSDTGESIYCADDDVVGAQKEFIGLNQVRTLGHEIASAVLTGAKRYKSV